MLPTEIELYDPDIYVNGVPHATMSQLRKEAPVFWHDKAEKDGRGFWAIMKHADIVRISKDPKTFSSFRGGTNIPDYAAEDLSNIQLLMLNMDPPQHAKFRKLVSLGFTPRMVTFMEPKIRERVRNIVDAMANRGSCDFVTSVSSELPLQVMAELLGVPMEERNKMFDWSNRLIGFDDPEFQTSIEDARLAAFDIWSYSQQLGDQRKGKDGTDLISILVNAQVDGESLTDLEVNCFFLLLAVAGNETTRNLVSGATLALIEHPDQYARLVADPSLIPFAVDEFLRWVTPVMHFRRTATRDVEIRGQKIREGDKVVMYYNSANRDEDVFPNSQVFDVGRTPNDHLAFGVGEHFCLGNSLARLEIRIMFEELLRRIPDLRLAGKVRRLRSNFINGVKEMPVEFTPERARRTA
jgi:cholest-4-en-3-one 26-monooxygenase